MAQREPPLANIVTLGVRDFGAQRDFYRRLGWPQCRDAYFADPEGNYWEIAWASADNPVSAAAHRAAGIVT